MRHVFAVLIAVVSAGTVGAQNDIPPRFQALAKNDRFKLVRILGTPELHATFASTSAFSADGKRAVYVEDLTTGSDDKPMFRARLIVSDTQGKAWPREIEIDGRNVIALDLAADGKTALLTGYRAKEKESEAYLSVWDLDQAKQIHFVTAGNQPILAMALSPDGKTALAATPHGGLKRWDLVTGKTINTDVKEKLNITALTYLPDGKRFLAGYEQGEVRLFDVAKDDPIRTFKTKGKHQFIWHLAVASDGSRFAATDYSAQAGVALWEVDTGKELGVFQLEKAAADDLFTGLALGRDGKTVFMTVSKSMVDPDDFACTKLIAWDATKSKILWTGVAGYRGRVPLVAQTDSLMVGGGPNLLDVWGASNGQRVKSTGGHCSPINVVAVQRTGDVISGGQEGVLLAWRKGQLVNRQPAHTGAITCLAVNGNTLLTAGTDLVIRQWPKDERTPAFAKKHTATITSLACSPSGSLIASGSADRSVRTWSAGGAEIASLTGHAEGINAVAISPDEQWIASGSDDTSVRVWPVKKGTLDPDRDVIVLEEHKKPVTCVVFSADGKTLYSASQDQTIKIWDVAKGKCTRTLTGHKNWITSFTLVDDRTALTTSDDLSVCLWDLETGKELGRIDFGIVGDCPRCLARAGNRIVIGTSSWLIYEFEMSDKSKSAGASSK